MLVLADLIRICDHWWRTRDLHLQVDVQLKSEYIVYKDSPIVNPNLVAMIMAGPGFPALRGRLVWLRLPRRRPQSRDVSSTGAGCDTYRYVTEIF